MQEEIESDRKGEYVLKLNCIKNIKLAVKPTITFYRTNIKFHTLKNHDKYIIQIFTEVIIKFLLYACI